MALSLCFSWSKLVLLITMVVGLMAPQLIACSEQATGTTGNGGDVVAKSNAENLKNTASSTEWAFPVMVIKQNQASPSLDTKEGDNSKPDMILIWLKPYESFIPEQIMDMIDENVRPQTEQISAQMLSQIPGAEQFWSQLSGFQNTLSNMGGLQSLLNGASGSGGSNPLSGLVENFGRRRRR